MSRRGRVADRGVRGHERVRDACRGSRPAECVGVSVFGARVAGRVAGPRGLSQFARPWCLPTWAREADRATPGRREMKAGESWAWRESWPRTPGNCKVRRGRRMGRAWTDSGGGRCLALPQRLPQWVPNRVAAGAVYLLAGCGLLTGFHATSSPEKKAALFWASRTRWRRAVPFANSAR
jgi:hypothetical protein